jgi:hypothetical protein
MNNRRPPQPDDDEQLSAYLLGDLSHADAAALERALADDPQRAARLDALADALAALGGVDDVGLPDGFEQRLASRLEGGGNVVDLDAERRARRTQWMAGAAAVAVVVFGAVFANNIVGGGSEDATMAGGADSGAESVAGPVLLDSEVAIADEAALQRRYGQLPAVTALLGTDTEDAPALAEEFVAAVPTTLEGAPPPAAQPYVMADGEGPVTDAAEARDDDEDAKEQGVTLSGSGGGAGADAGRSVPAAPPERAKVDFEANSAAKARAPTANVRSCLREISADATEPLVPALIETLRYAGQRAFAFVLVTSSPDSTRLDRTEVWVVSRKDCTTLVFQQY